MENYVPRLADGAIQAADWISLSSGLGGAVLGALIGGAIAWALAHQAGKGALKRDIARVEEQTKARCLKLMVKASMMLSDVAGIQRAIDDSLEQANKKGLTSAPLWQRVIPLVGAFNPLPFEADEAAALMAIKENDLAQQAIELFGRHENFLVAVRTYSEKRQGFASLVGRHIDLGGGTLSSILTDSELSRVTPYTIELESLIKQIRTHAAELRTLAEQVTFGIGPAVRSKLDAADFPLMVPLDIASSHPSSDSDHTAC